MAFLHHRDYKTLFMYQQTIFVFGSNLAGRHGAGAAREAADRWGALAGKGGGSTGRAYAIPTKDANLNVRSLDEIKDSVASFLDYATRVENQIFLVTAIGTGLAGYRHYQIAPMFRNAPANCWLPIEWVPFVIDKDDLAVGIVP